jgi:SAM-dependent methyltransferase
VATDASPAMLGYLDRRLESGGVRNVRTAVAELPHVGSQRRFDGALSVGVFNYLEDLDSCLRGLRDVVRPGGWIVFTVPHDSFGGRVYRASELISRHRVWLHTRASAGEAARRSGLEVVASASAGFTRSGLTLVTLAKTDDPGAS